MSSLSLLLRRSVMAVTALTLGLSVTLPASAESFQRASNQNLWHVRHHLEFDIDQLQRDQRDYGGYRVRAIANVQAAREQLLQAEEFEHGRRMGGFGGDDDTSGGMRDQWQSDRNLWMVRRDIERQSLQLERDASDYGGHKAAAIAALQRARRDLTVAERYAHRRGY